MAYFYKKDGEIFVPEKINPDLVKLCFGITKACKLSFKYQMKSTSLQNALKAGRDEQMLSLIQKCLEKNRKLYDQDMALTGVTVEEVDEAFFADKDTEFLKNQIQVLIDFAMINTVAESRMMNILAASCEKILGTPLNKIKFFTNQETILEVDDEEDEDDDDETTLDPNDEDEPENDQPKDDEPQDDGTTVADVDTPVGPQQTITPPHIPDGKMQITNTNTAVEDTSHIEMEMQDYDPKANLSHFKQPGTDLLKIYPNDEQAVEVDYDEQIRNQNLIEKTIAAIDQFEKCGDKRQC